MFPTLDVHDLSEILVGNNWNIEASFEAALALNSSRDLIEEEYMIRDEVISVQAVEVTDDLPSKSKICGQIVPSTNPTNMGPPLSYISSSHWQHLRGYQKMDEKPATITQNSPEIITMYRESAASNTHTPVKSG